MKYVNKAYAALFLKGILILTICNFSISNSQAGIEPVLRNVLQDTSLRVDSLIVVEDVQYNLNQLDDYSLVSSKNRISLALNQDNLLYCMNDSFGCEVSAEVKSWDKDGILSTDTISLSVNYNIEKGEKYQERNTHVFEGAYKIEAKILSICDTFLAPFLIFSVEIELERYKDFDADDVPEFYTHSINLDNEIEVSWEVLEGAEEYELEWLIVDDYDGDGSYLTTSEIEYSFRHNSARVVLSSNSYKVSAVHEHGYLLFRVRGIGLTGSQFTHRINGKWSSDGYSNLVSAFNLSKDAYQISTLEHEPDLNWQYVASFAEEGKKKEIVSYYDGSLRNRQSVTRVNSDENTIVSENHYDYQGRMAIQVLPVPSFENILKYYTNFSRFEDGVLYDKSRFDTGKCEVNTPAMNDSSGASLYYSSSNLDLNGPNAHLASYIPDAEGFPFSRTLYMDDNTGRIRAQGGVGLNHQLGSGHETKYFYATPFQEDIDRLFGNSVGKNDHYQKNMVVDPNGQVSVSYLDLSGRVIATSLAGETPENVVELENKTDSVNMEVNLLSDSDSLLNKSSLSFSKTFVVAKNSWHYFDYSVNPAIYQDSCMDTSMCLDCVYDLVISLKDDCGTELLDGDKNTAGIQELRRTIGTPIEFLNTSCDSGYDYSFEDDILLEEDVKAYLTVGSYTLSKTLKINEAALEYYTDEFVKNTNCVKTLEDFENDFISKIDYSGCELSCDSCLIDLGTEADFVSRIMSELSEEGLTPNEEDTINAIAMYEDQVDRCNFLCQEESPCSIYKTILEIDIAEGGQYEEEGYTSITQHPEYCIYQACITNEECKLFDQKMQQTATLKEALALGYLDPLNYKSEYPDGEEDECITDVPANETALKAKLDAYTDIGGTDISLWDFVVLAFHCNDENATNAELLTCISNYTLDSSSCGLQGDMMWNLFKSAYIAEKNLILESGICTPTIAEGKERRLYTIQNVLDLPDGATSSEQKDNMQDSLDVSFTDNCNAYADFWMQKLIGCNLSESDSIAVRNALIDVCIDGSDNTHPLGSSSVAPDKEGSATYLNFHEVLVDKGVYVKGVCDDLLIEYPAPYGSDLNVSLTVDSTCTDNSCEDGLSQEIKEALRMAQFPAECDKCIDCNKLKNGVDSLYTFYEDSVYFDAENRKWHLVIEAYLNREFGMNMFYPDYLEMARKCTSYDTTDSLVLDSLRKVSYFSNSNNKVTSFIKKDKNYASTLIKTQDGNKALLYSSRKNNNERYLSLVKLNDKDSVLWNIDYYSDSMHDAFNQIMDIKETIDSGFVFVGASKWRNRSVNSSVIIKTDENGSIEWQKILNGPEAFGNNIIRKLHIADSGFIIGVGEYYGNESSGSDYASTYQVKFNNQGDVIYSKLPKPYAWPTIRYSATCQIHEMKSKRVIGITEGLAAGNPNHAFNLFKLSENGDRLEEKHFQLTDNWGRLNNFTPCDTFDHEFLAIGWNHQNQSTNFSLLLVKFDSSLNLVWKKEIGDVSKYAIQGNKIEKFGEDYIISFNYFRDLNYTDTIFKGLMRINSNGDVIWAKTYGKEYENFSPYHPDDFIINDSNLIKLSVSSDYFNDTMDIAIVEVSIEDGESPNCYTQDLNNIPVSVITDEFIYNYDELLTTYIVPDSNWNTSNFVDSLKVLNDSIYCRNYKTFDTTICEQKYEPIYTNRCREILEIHAKASAKIAYQTYIDSVRSAFQQRYTRHCIQSVEEEFNMTFEHQEYHFTLYYYDQAGNLIQTIPPQGVVLIEDQNRLDSVKLARLNNVNYIYPMHTFKTRYQFNTLNQLTAQTTPDAGRSSFFYDRLGRMAVSQNSKQKRNNKYSYTEYDELGRIKEVGQLSSGIIEFTNPEIIDEVGVDIDIDGTITKTASHAWGNAGGISKVQFSGNCFVEHIVDNNESISAAVGLSYTNPDNGYTSIKYKWYVHNSYYVNSANGYHGSGPVDGDVLRVERRNDSILFKLNGVIKNVLIEEETGQPLFLDFAIYTSGKKIKDLKIGGQVVVDFDLVFDNDNLNELLENADKEEITETFYDEEYFVISKENFTQKYLRNRVVSTTYRDHDTLPYQSAVHYSYDIHGNVYSLVRETPELSFINQQYKQTDYSYDLVSGNVKAVHYQRGEVDQFSHRYFYDLDNRLTYVETSENEVYWDKEVKYFYYKHGPLARAEIGNLQVQGMDYAYTLHGWLKGVNSTSLRTSRDIGQDGEIGTVNQFVCKDEFGYSLGYYENDYKNVGGIIQSDLFYAGEQGSKLADATHDLYNGNISTMITAIGQFMNGETPLGKAYAYDQLNRIVGASYFENYDSITNTWKNTGTELDAYKSSYSYDANGNLLTLDRNGIAGNTDMDQMSYHYVGGTNKLSYVTDAVSSSNYSSDIDKQRAFNYLYDEIGNLVRDESEQIDKIDWTVYGKIKRITRDRSIVPTYQDMVYTTLDTSTGELGKAPIGGIFDKWAKSGEIIPEDGYIEYTVPAALSDNYYLKIGLSYLDNTSDYPNYSLYTNNGTQAYAYRINANVGGSPLSGVGTGSTLRVEREGDSIYYKVNGTIYHRRKEDQIGDSLLMHVQLYHISTRVYVDDLEMNNGSSFTPTISEKYQVIHEEEDNVLRIGPHNGWQSGGASVEKVGGDGYMKFSLGNPENNKGMVVGLSYTNPNQHYNTIDYGWYTNDGMTLKIYESGSPKTVSHGELNPGDVLSVERIGTTIYYKLNGVIKRSVTEASPSDSLMIDFALYDRDCILAGVKMYSEHLSNEVYKPDLEFAYTPDGHRNMKRVIWADSTKTTWYGIEVNGNILSTYEHFKTYDDSSSTFTQTTSIILGSSRVGVQSLNKTLVVISGEDTSFITRSTYNYTRGGKHYELSNHLGNVQVVLTDKRLPVCDETTGITLSYKAEVISAYDYYPFGSPMEDRTYEYNKYSYGFNGMEKNDDINGIGTSYTTFHRQYDPRLGRWLSKDPMAEYFHYFSPYIGIDDNPILLNDPYGNCTNCEQEAADLSARTERGEVEDGERWEDANGNIMEYDSELGLWGMVAPKQVDVEHGDNKSLLNPSQTSEVTELIIDLIELAQEAQPVIDGIVNSAVSNQFLGKGRIDPISYGNNGVDADKFAFGQLIGDAFSIIAGAFQAEAGATAAVGGVAAIPETGGLSIVVAEAGVVATAHGITVMTVAGENLIKGLVDMMSNKSNGGGGGKKRKKKKSGVSGKDGSKDVPSWVKETGETPFVGESGNEFAKRLMDGKYGPGNYKTKSGEFSQIRKWADRSFE